MVNISLQTMQKMKSVGFSYPEYEHFLNFGMCYYYNGSEYWIGGAAECEFTERDRLVARDGIWLPDELQLYEWLQKNKFDISVDWSADDGYFHLRATDKINGHQYSAGGIDLSNSLAKLIYKICKSQRRDYIPETTLQIHL